MTIKQTQIFKNIPQKINNNQVLHLIKGGEVNYQYLSFIKELSNLNDEVISACLNMNVKTYRNFKKTKSAIKEDVQEHVIMILALIKHGIDVFGNNDNFNKWLYTDNFYFNKKKPIEFLNTISGIKLIDDRLTGMEYGDNA